MESRMETVPEMKDKLQKELMSGEVKSASKRETEEKMTDDDIKVP